MQKIDHERNAEWMNNINKELEEIEEGSQVNIHLDLPRATLKKIPNLKTPGFDGISILIFKIYVHPP